MPRKKRTDVEKMDKTMKKNTNYSTLYFMCPLYQDRNEKYIECNGYKYEVENVEEHFKKCCAESVLKCSRYHQLCDKY